MRILKIVVATLLCSAAFAASANAQTRYPLHCRAGGDMRMNIAGQASGGGTEIIIGFTRATVTTGLPPGTCAWVDRPMNSREPASFRLIVRARMNFDFRPRPGRDAGDRAGLYVYPDSGPDVALAQSIVNAVKNGGTFEVQAFNSGRAPMNAIDFREAPAR